jgi:hypothetical protein
MKKTPFITAALLLGAIQVGHAAEYTYMGRPCSQWPEWEQRTAG